MMTAKFDDASVVWFSPTKSKHPDLTKLQAAMFMDRPDLWRKAPPKRQRQPRPEQLKMFDDPGYIYLGLPPRCRV